MTSPSRDPDVPALTSGDVEIVERALDHPDAEQLLRAFYDEQIDRYGFADRVDLDKREYSSPNGIFAVAYRRGRPVACGGYRRFPHQLETIEIKKTYLVPGMRGQGIGYAMLSWLEDHAAATGARQVILETGVRNTGALHLFTRSGYRPTGSYVEGRDPSINRAFMKLLAQSNQPATES